LAETIVNKNVNLISLETGNYDACYDNVDRINGWYFFLFSR